MKTLLASWKNPQGINARPIGNHSNGHLSWMSANPGRVNLGVKWQEASVTFTQTSKIMDLITFDLVWTFQTPHDLRENNNDLTETCIRPLFYWIFLRSMRFVNVMICAVVSHAFVYFTLIHFRMKKNEQSSEKEKQRISHTNVASCDLSIYVEWNQFWVNRHE